MKARKLSVLVLSLMMVLTMGASSVFAAGQNSGKNGGATTYAAGEAKLVKYLTAAEGITLPTETFTFTFTPASPETANNFTVPAGSYTERTATIAVSDMTSADAEDTQNMVGSKTIAEIFSGYTFPRAGEYTYTVTENAGATEGMTYSTESYTLRLLVDKDGNIDDVTVENQDGNKTNPTDVDPTDNEGGATPSKSNGGFTFTNNYSRNVTSHDEPTNPNPDPDPEDPDNPDPINEDDTKSVSGAFALKKFVLGEYGDQTKAFTFNVTVVLPAANSTFDVTKEGNVTGATWNADGTVELKHGQDLTFNELPVGTKITVSEADYTDVGYKALMTTSQSDDATTVLIGEKGGYVICRNSFHDEQVTPTGIVINNLPYILLIAIALGGIVLFSRKRRYE